MTVAKIEGTRKKKYIVASDRAYYPHVEAFDTLEKAQEYVMDVCIGTEGMSADVVYICEVLTQIEIVDELDSGSKDLDSLPTVSVA